MRSRTATSTRSGAAARVEAPAAGDTRIGSVPALALPPAATSTVTAPAVGHATRAGSVRTALASGSGVSAAGTNGCTLTGLTRSGAVGVTGTVSGRAAYTACAGEAIGAARSAPTAAATTRLVIRGMAGSPFSKSELGDDEAE